MPSLIRPQAAFLALPHQFRAYVAGYRAGKTWAGAAALCKHFWEHPGVDCGYFGPTYPSIRDVFFPTIERVAADWGLQVEIKEANKEVLMFAGGKYRGMIKCRSMEHPHRIVGFEIGRALVDEIDTLTQKKAQQAWDKILGRMSLVFDGENGIDVTTTPEGFKFTYDRWVKSVREDTAKGSPRKLAEKYGLIQASTYENEQNLPEGYISSLLGSYTDHLTLAYLMGEFVNMTSGTVYKQYNREKNRSKETIKPDEPLFIGMDFNIGNMSAVVHVKRDGNPHAVDEIVGAFDTPDIIRIIKERYWPYVDGDYRRTHQIRVYPDASGKARSRQGSAISDHQLLEGAGFMLSTPPGNPPVRDRVNSMNAMFCNAMGERRYFVNDDKCPTYAENLEQQAYDERGEPDKKSGKDHSNDAGGYFIHRDYPLARPVTNLNLRFAM